MLRHNQLMTVSFLSVNESSFEYLHSVVTLAYVPSEQALDGNYNCLQLND